MDSKQVIKEMNKLRLIPIVALSTVVAALSIGVALMLGVLYSWLAGIAVFVAAILAGRRINHTDPKLVELFFLSLKAGTDYDPALLEDIHDFPQAD